MTDKTEKTEKTSDAARTGKEADENRDALLKDAEKGLKDARGKLPKGEI
ncbi:UNVERIFIED_ORG: hypothetical protein J2W19_003146 [Shinella zoogloeoides]|nr:hypothetical protein [Shinella zoogloeoides]